jgi:hypothetical protein
MFCIQCGHRNPEGAHFCANCGAALVTTPAGREVGIMVASPPAAPGRIYISYRREDTPTRPAGCSTGSRTAIRIPAMPPPHESPYLLAEVITSGGYGPAATG